MTTTTTHANPTTAEVLAAFRQDSAAFDRLLHGLTDAQWALATPAPGWDVRAQVAHLAFVYDLAALSCTDPERFGAAMARVPAGGFGAAVEQGMQRFSAGHPADVLDRWVDARDRVANALAAATGPTVPWLVNPLPPAVLTAAGMLELFAHGQDVADAVGHDVDRTDTVAHIVGFVARTTAFGFESHGLGAPAHPFRFRVTLPSGRLFETGPADAGDVVEGPAVDVCLLASRRRHHLDLDVQVRGADAERWLTVAQAYRGPAGEGRRPGQFA